MNERRNRSLGWFAAAAVAAVACVAALMAPAQVPQASAYDVLVVGGTAKGVAAATAAKAAGANVFLVTPFPYLGEDLAGTLELGLPEGQRPLTELVKRLWAGSTDHADYDYWPERRTDGIRWIYKNDWWHRISEPLPPPSPSDGVWYNEDISYRCVLKKPAKIARIEVIALTTQHIATEGVVANVRKVAEVGGRKKKVAETDSAVCIVKAGPLAGRTFELKRAERTFQVEGDAYRGTATACSYVADVNAELSEVEVIVRKSPDADHQLVSRIWFHLADRAGSFAPPSPLKVKRTFDRVLVEAGVGFLTGTAVVGVSRDAAGGLTGVRVANRSGTREIRAKRVIDATRYGVLSHFGTDGVVLPVGKEETFSRVVIVDGPPPSAPGMTVERLPGTFPVAHGNLTGRMYRCTFRLPMKDGSYASFAAAEWAARELTATKNLMDDADLLVWHTPGWKPLEERIREGEELGRTVATPQPTQAPQPPQTSQTSHYDVVVVGGGTSGTPAAIAAAREGAKVLIVEYLHVLGGVGTDGMVLGYFDGNHCGFTERFKKGNEEIGGRIGLYRRAETWRKWCCEAGVEVMFGAMGFDAVVEKGVLKEVTLATALGPVRVRATCFIDGTGNSDLAAAAGAHTWLFGSGEFAMQSAGQAPHRLGMGGINSDFGYLNDSDAADLWLFGLRARAGAPDAWDIAKMPDSRERRRIVPDYLLNAQDVTSKRPFPDVVVQARSRQDSHGFLVDDFCALAESSVTPVIERGDSCTRFDVNVPLRSLLPKGISHLAVVGLSAGVARDVQPIIRMQADLMNMGYAVGIAAARAARSQGGEFRAIDFAALRRTLVKEGILRDEALGWNADEDVSSDALLAASVETMGDAFKGSHVVFRPENRARAIPLLRAAYGKSAAAEASGKGSAAARQIYAVALGFLGDATGVETLLRLADGSEKSEIPSRIGAFGGGRTTMRDILLALARTKDPRVRKPLLRHLAEIGKDPQSSLEAIRGITHALTAFGDPMTAPAIAACLRKDGLHGFAVSDFRKLAPQGGYGLGPEMDNCMRELALARALLACGDHKGLARETFEAYARDPRGILALYARQVLAYSGFSG